ncbi:HTH-type transcriptional regulator DmlR [compost metagenome]
MDGHGIIMASYWDVAGSLQEGSLLRVLPAYHQPADVWAVTAARSSSSAKVRSCVAFLREQLAEGPFALAVGG